MRLGIGTYLVQDYPELLHALGSFDVSPISLENLHDLWSAEMQPFNAVIFSEVARSALPYFRMKLSHEEHRQILFILATTSDTGSASPLVQAGLFDCELTITGAKEQIYANFRDLVDEWQRKSPETEQIKFGSSNEIRTIKFQDDVDTRIVQLVAIGATDREIARTLYLAEHTVRNRLSRLMSRSHIANRTELTSLYSQNLLCEILEKHSKTSSAR